MKSTNRAIPLFVIAIAGTGICASLLLGGQSKEIPHKEQALSQSPIASHGTVASQHEAPPKLNPVELASLPAKPTAGSVSPVAPQEPTTPEKKTAEPPADPVKSTTATASATPVAAAPKVTAVRAQAAKPTKAKETEPTQQRPVEKEAAPQKPVARVSKPKSHPISKQPEPTKKEREAPVVSSETSRKTPSKTAEAEPDAKFYRVGIKDAPTHGNEKSEPASELVAFVPKVIEVVGKKAFIQVSDKQTIVATIGDVVPGKGKIKDIKDGKITFE